MSTDQTALLAAAAGVGAFVLGRLVLQPAGGGTDVAAPAAAPAAPAATDSSSASLDFPAGDPAGVLSGVYPITDQFGNPVSGTGGGGLPGGGGVTTPPPPTSTPPPIYPTPAPTPAPTYPYPASLGPKPLTATGYISVTGGTFYRYIQGGARTTYSGRTFSAWVSGPVLIRWSGGSASVYRILTSAYAGWLVGTTGVTFRKI